MKIVGIIPVKSVSTRIPDKNFMCLNDGKPLFKRAYSKLSNIKLIDKVYIDTDDPDKVREFAPEIPSQNILHRPKELSLSSANGHNIMKWAGSQVEGDIIVQHLCTAPFVSSTSIMAAIMHVLGGHDTCFTGTKVIQYAWDSKGNALYDYKKLPNSQELEYTIIETMGLYVVKRSYLEKTGLRTKENSGIVFVSGFEAFDINYPADLEAAKVLKRVKEKW